MAGHIFAHKKEVLFSSQKKIHRKVKKTKIRNKSGYNQVPDWTEDTSVNK